MDAAIVETVDRLVDGINGDDPEGVHLFMDGLQEQEANQLISYFADLVMGEPLTDVHGYEPRPVPSVVRVAPADFLKVLVEGRATMFRALHIVLEAIGIGHLRGRSATHCLSEVHICLSTCSGNDGFSVDQPLIPLAHLRVLAGLCLSLAIDHQPQESGPANREGSGARIAGQDFNNRRMLMLEALPPILRACCSVANGKRSDSGLRLLSGEVGYYNASSGECWEEGTDKAEEIQHPGGIVSQWSGKGKGIQGKGHASKKRGCNSLGDITSTKEFEQSERAVLRDITDVLLAQPWPPELVLPLLVTFGELSDLLDCLKTDGPDNFVSRNDPSHKETGEGGMRTGRGQVEGQGEHSAGGGVWARVRGRLMECLLRGCLDGADLTGIARQVCVMCEMQYVRHWESTSSTRTWAGEPKRDVDSRPGGDQDIDKENEHTSWLRCLRMLYAAVPSAWLATVELVLEQILHHMPDVAEGLLDLTCAEVWRGNPREGSLNPNSTPVKAGFVQHAMLGLGSEMSTSSSRWHDVGMLLLLLREASPLVVCTLPLLPLGLDRSLKVEKVLKTILMHGHQHHKSDLEGGNDVGAGSQVGLRGLGRDRATSDDVCACGGVGLRLLLHKSLSGGDGSGGSSEGGGIASRGGTCGGQSSGLMSQRASQLLDLALKWLGGGVWDLGASGGRELLIESAVGACSTVDLVLEIVSVVFEDVPGARPQVLRSLLGGVIDQTRGIVSGQGYLDVWEGLMAREALNECLRVVPHSQVVSDSLGHFVLLPPQQGRRLLESVVPLANSCSSHAGAMITLCRKCASQGDSKGPLLSLHSVTTMIVWTIAWKRRTRASVMQRTQAKHQILGLENVLQDPMDGERGALCEEGIQEDLICILQRALQGNLETWNRSEALHHLATKVSSLSHHWEAHEGSPPTETETGEAVQPVSAVALTSWGKGQGRWTDSDLRLGGDRHTGSGQSLLHTGMGESAAGAKADSLDGEDMVALDGLHSVLIDRLSRFLSTKSHEDNSTAGGYVSSANDKFGVYGADKKGKTKVMTSTGGRLQLVLLRLFLACAHPSQTSQAGGYWVSGDDVGKVAVCAPRRIICRDAIGQLFVCCWALVPTAPAQGGGRQGVTGKLQEAEVVARVMLGQGLGCRKDGLNVGIRGAPVTTVGKALVAVVEFLSAGGTLKMRKCPPTEEDHEGDGDEAQYTCDVLPQCNPNLVGALPALALVLTLGEALVECLLNTGVYGPSSYFIGPALTDCATATETDMAKIGNIPKADAAPLHLDRPNEDKPSSVIFRAVTDAFSLLGVAARAAQGISNSTGTPKAGRVQDRGLSSVIRTLPGEILGLTQPRNEDNIPSNKDGTIKPELHHQLLSTKSALTYAQMFLDLHEQMQADRVGVKPGEEWPTWSWDEGLGVWLGLVHCVSTLRLWLEAKAGGGCGTSDAPADEETDKETVVTVVGLILRLRAAVCNPIAACRLLSRRNSFPSYNSDSLGIGEINQEIDLGGDRYAATPSEDKCPVEPPLPTSASMVAGFLGRMSERWRAHVSDWGLPGLAPPRRSSPRLGRNHSNSSNGSRCGGRSSRSRDRHVPEELQEEAEDLYFALWEELMRTEVVATTILLNGTQCQRAWFLRTAPILIKARVPENAFVAADCEDSSGTSGDNHRKLPRRKRVSPLLVSAGTRLGYVSPDNSGGHLTEPSSGASLEAHKGLCNASANTLTLTPPSHAQTAGNSLPDLPSRISVKGESEGYVFCILGELCRYVALELREGLEQGLSVKLVQAYLDLLELLGMAALESRKKPNGIQETTIGVTKPLASKTDDAGDVLMSILTHHCVSQVTLFQRIVRGALRFDGVGQGTEAKQVKTGLQLGTLPPKGRCWEVVCCCIKWLQENRADGRYKSDQGVGSKAEESGAAGGNSPPQKDSKGSVYNPSPSSVQMASSRECHAALAVALAELEASLALGSTRYVFRLSTAIGVLQEIFTPLTQTLLDGHDKTKSQRESGRVHKRDKEDGANTLVVEVLPEALKLRVMVLLDKIYTSGRGAALAASTALAAESLHVPSMPIMVDKEKVTQGVVQTKEHMLQSTKVGEARSTELSQKHLKKKAEVTPQVGSASPLERFRGNPELVSILNAGVAVVSEAFFRLEAVTRKWIEGQRIGVTTREGSDKLCRKKASTVLFKMDRLDLERSRAAGKASMLLDRWGQIDSSGVDDCGDGIDYHDQCALESSLRILVEGGTHLLLREEVSRGRNDSTGHDLKKSSVVDGEEQQSDEDQGTMVRGCEQLGTRRRKRQRIRSRNNVIDGWLGEEDGTDAYVDLEDFIVE
ncbi:unnamed protein product [Choristocarpus tenellus]